MHARCQLFWLIALAALGSTRAQVDGVLTLTEGDFDYLLTKHKRVFVQWYAPYCAECKALWPKLTDVAKNLKSSGHKTKLAQLDATLERNLAAKWAIAGPVLHYFVHGKLLATYDGQQSADAITKWLQKRERPEVFEVKAGEEERFLNDTDADSFALLAHVRQQSPRHTAFSKSLGPIMDVLHDSDDLSLGVVWLSENANPKTDAKLTMRRSGFQSPDLVDIDFNGAWSAIDIASWVNTNSFPTLGRRFSAKYDPAIVRDLGWDGVVVMCLKDTDEEDDSMDEESIPQNALFASMAPTISKYPRWKFALCDLGALREKDQEALLGAKTVNLTNFVSLRHGARTRYVLEGTREEIESGLGSFLEQAHAGKLFSRYKSEPTLAQEVVEGVTLLTGHTFEERIMNPRLDFFVYFTHARCHHCKDLDPVWKKLASEVIAKGWEAQGVVIAKMDVERNECAEEIEEYPRLVLYPAVKADQKMKKKRIYKPQNIETLGSLPTSKLLDFLSSNAATLEGVEEQELEAEIVKNSKYKDKRKRKSKKEL